MPDLSGFLVKWWIPLFWLIYLLVAYFRAEDKRNWLKTTAKISAITAAIMLPMLLIGIVEFFSKTHS